jgi:hypothetical protein
MSGRPFVTCIDQARANGATLHSPGQRPTAILLRPSSLWRERRCASSGERDHPGRLVTASRRDELSLRDNCLCSSNSQRATRGGKSSFRRDAETRNRDGCAPDPGAGANPQFQSKPALTIPKILQRHGASRGRSVDADVRRRTSVSSGARPPSLPRGLQRRHSLFVVAEVTRLKWVPRPQSEPPNVGCYIFIPSGARRA